jgi:hypothetical protein
MTKRGADYKRRKGDNYPTPLEVAGTLLSKVLFAKTLCDPCCGKKKNLLKAFKANGYRAVGTDIVFGTDFIEDRFKWRDVDIVTNPPYGSRRATLAVRFIERALTITKPWRGRVAMLLPADFDSGKSRAHLFTHPAFCGKIILLDRIKWFNNRAGSTNHQWCIWDWKNTRAPTVRYSRTMED